MREMKERLRCRGRKKRERERLTVRNLCFGVLCVCVDVRVDVRRRGGRWCRGEGSERL